MALFLTTLVPRPFLGLAVFQIVFRAISASKPAVEEEVALLAGNLETDVAEAFSRGNGLLTFTANNSRLKFHGLPPGLSGPYLRHRKWNEKGDKRNRTWSQPGNPNPLLRVLRCSLIAIPFRPYPRRASLSFDATVIQ